MWFEIICLSLVVLLFAIVIYLVVRSVQIDSKVDTAVAEIKSKIGSIIKDVNAINLQDYKVDVQQSTEIAALKRGA